MTSVGASGESGESGEQQPSKGSPKARREAGLIAKCILLAAAVLPFAALATCSAPTRPYSVDGWGWGLGLFGLGGLMGFITLMIFVDGIERRFSGPALIVNVVGMVATVAYFFAHATYARGRQLRGPRGRVLPERAPEPPIPSGNRERAARAWRNNGDTEAASVSAFAMLSLDLAQLGAPLELSRAAHEDALDEIRHAELCYGLARARGDVGARHAPMPGLAELRGRPCTLARVAVESFVEGAYLEAVSAEIAVALRAIVADDAVRAVLDVIAADEARHAAHAWEVVAWCRAADPATVGPALVEVLDRIPTPDPPRDEPGTDGSLEPLGIPGRELQLVIATRCRAESQTRLRQLLAPSMAPAGGLPRLSATGTSHAREATRSSHPDGASVASA